MINSQNAKLYCRDDLSLIENYDKAVADTAHVWDLHHRLELTLDGEFAHSKEDLIRMDMYYDRPYFELILLTKSEHRRLHKKGKNSPLKGKHRSDETKRKISDAMKGRHYSAETRKKMSEAQKAYWSRRRAINTNK